MTDSVVASLKPQRGQSGWRELADGATRGLCIRISPRGEKVWAIRHVVGGKRSRHTIGAYPTVSLADVRKRASEYLSGTRDGMSPEEVDARAQALAITVKQAHAAYLEAVTVSTRASTRMDAPYELVEGTVHRALRASRWVALVELRERPGVVELSVGDTWVLHPGDSVVFLGRQDIQTGKFLAPCYRNITSGVRGCRSSGGMTDPSRAMIKLWILTGQRRDEVRCMRWEELDFTKRLWTLPPERNKAKRLHVIPLSPQVVAILNNLMRLGPYVFSASPKGDRPYAGQKRLKEILERKADTAGWPTWTFHDFRRTAATGMADLRVPMEVIARVLNHANNTITAVYNRHAYLEEKRDALDRWAAHVEEVVSQPAPAKPVAPPRRRARG